MAFDKMKSGIGVRLSINKAMRPINTCSQLAPESFSEKTRKVYQPPTLTILDTYKIESGGTYVPEGSTGQLSSAS